MQNLRSYLKNKSHPKVTLNGAGSIKAYSSRDSARIAKSELLTLQIYELFLKLASFLAKKIKKPSFRVAVLKWVVTFTACPLGILPG